MKHSELERDKMIKRAIEYGEDNYAIAVSFNTTIETVQQVRLQVPKLGGELSATTDEGDD
jgi:hypothetical protein